MTFEQFVESLKNTPSTKISDVVFKSKVVGMDNSITSPVLLVLRRPSDNIAMFAAASDDTLSELKKWQEHFNKTEAGHTISIETAWDQKLVSNI